MSLFDEQVRNDLHRLFAATGRRCYLIGTLEGGFPDLGHHLPGEMGGVWVPPVKLADGFWFGLSERGNEQETCWMYGPTCESFRMQPGRVEREFLLQVGGAPIEAVQQLFIPDNDPGVLVELTLHNQSEEAVRLTLSWLVRWDIQGAWWSNWPDRPDFAMMDDGPSTIAGRLSSIVHRPSSLDGWGGIVAWDSGHAAWSGAMLSDHMPDRRSIGADLWGPERTGSLLGVEGVKRGGILPDPPALQGAGISGRLSYDLTLEPGQRRALRFALAGGVEGPSWARQKVTGLLAEYDALLRNKIAGQEALTEAASSIETPEPDMDRAYSLQNVCMDMLTVEMPGVARGAVAGLPSFAWYFGCDTYYSISGLLMAGQGETAISNLRLLANYARRQGGRTPHEITQTGTLFNPGNSVETAEFVTSVERAYRWTGDRAFLQEMYGVCKEGIFDHLLGERDPGHDITEHNGQHMLSDRSEGRTYLPEGPGLLELSSAGRGRKLDVAAALHQGLRSLAYLAGSVGDAQTVDRCEEARVKVRESIDRHFWVADRGEYVWRIEDDLSVSPEEPAHSYVMMEMGVLDGSDAQDAARITSLFAKMEDPEHTGPKGMIHPGTRDFVMPVGNAIVALAEFQYGRPDRGLWYLERIAEVCDRGMPWAIPEFEFLRGGYRPCFLQLWSSAAYNWLAVQGWFRLLPDPDRGVVLVRPQLPTGWQGARVKNLTLWGERYDLTLQRNNGDIQLVVEPLSSRAHHPFRVDDTPGMPVKFV